MNNKITNNVMLHEIMTEETVIKNESQELIVFNAFDFEYKGVFYNQVEFQLNRDVKCENKTVYITVLIFKDGINYKKETKMMTGRNDVAFRKCARMLKHNDLHNYEKF